MPLPGSEHKLGPNTWPAAWGLGIAEQLSGWARGRSSHRRWEPQAFSAETAQENFSVSRDPECVSCQERSPCVPFPESFPSQNRGFNPYPNFLLTGKNHLSCWKEKGGIKQQGIFEVREPALCLLSACGTGSVPSPCSFRLPSQPPQVRFAPSRVCTFFPSKLALESRLGKVIRAEVAMISINFEEYLHFSWENLIKRWNSGMNLQVLDSRWGTHLRAIELPAHH